MESRVLPDLEWAEMVLDLHFEGSISPELDHQSA